MKTSHLYLLLCLIGIVLPYSQFVPWAVANGLDLPLFLQEVTTSRLAAFGWLDVSVSALALFVFVTTDGRRQHVPMLWLPFLATLSVGVSLGLPLYLYLRERRIEQADGI